MSLDPVFRPVASAPARIAEGRHATAESAGPAASRTVADLPMLANPTLRLDPALGIVVLEFRGTLGMPARSLPTENELAAYRAAAMSGAPRPGYEPAASDTVSDIPPATPPPAPHAARAGTGRGPDAAVT